MLYQIAGLASDPTKSHLYQQTHFYATPKEVTIGFLVLAVAFIGSLIKKYG
jgi:hypothetical protein